MTLADARALRDAIRNKIGLRCSVPTGYPPDRYFVRVVLPTKERRDFYSRSEWRQYAHDCNVEQTRILDDFCRKHGISLKARSPLDILIDRTCGLE